MYTFYYTLTSKRVQCFMNALLLLVYLNHVFRVGRKPTAIVGYSVCMFGGIIVGILQYIGNIYGLLYFLLFLYSSIVLLGTLY